MPQSESRKYFVDVGQMRYYSSVPECAKLRAELDFGGEHFEIEGSKRNSAEWEAYYQRILDRDTRIDELEARVEELIIELENAKKPLKISVVYPRAPWYKRLKTWFSRARS